MSASQALARRKRGRALIGKKLALFFHVRRILLLFREELDDPYRLSEREHAQGIVSAYDSNVDLFRSSVRCI
jgi:hypothetical protein